MVILVLCRHNWATGLSTFLGWSFGPSDGENLTFMRARLESLWSYPVWTGSAWTRCSWLQVLRKHLGKTCHLKGMRVLKKKKNNPLKPKNKANWHHLTVNGDYYGLKWQACRLKPFLKSVIQNLRSGENTTFFFWKHLKRKEQSVNHCWKSQEGLQMLWSRLLASLSKSGKG